MSDATESPSRAEYRLTGTGERFSNADGTSRQTELALCRRGDPLRLVREPDNPRDPLAVAILSSRGVQVGYVRRVDAQWLGREIDEGHEATATVYDVRSKTYPGSPLALTVAVTVVDRR